MKTLTIAILLTAATFGISNSVSAGSPYNDDPHPFRLYYYGYDMNHPGFGFGPEFTFGWTKVEHSKCTHGVRVSDRQFFLSPNAGMFSNTEDGVSLFGSLEVNYRITFHGGLTFETFLAGGYAQSVTNPFPIDPGTQDDGAANNASDAGHQLPSSGFLPQAGLGFGLNLQRMNGRDIPLAFHVRGLVSGIDPFGAGQLGPSFQAGVIYSF